MWALQTTANKLPHLRQPVAGQTQTFDPCAKMVSKLKSSAANLIIIHSPMVQEDFSSLHLG